jgi:hypothetical protein
MSTEAALEAEAEAETPLEQFEDDSAPDEVEQAKSMGWKAPSDWKGKPPKGKFLKAKEYLERAETVIPIMRSENKKLKDDLTEARKELREVKENTETRIAKLAQMSKVALDRQRQQLEDKYSAAIDAAAEVGDKELVRKLRKEEREQLKEYDEATEEASEVKAEKTETNKEKVNDALPKEVKDTIAGWITENNWYSTDPEMQMVANQHHGKLLKDKPGLTLEENLEETRKYIIKRYPEKFGKQEPEDDDEEDRSARGSRVEGGSRLAGAGGGTKWSKLPADAKAQGDRFIKEDGLFLQKGETVEKDLAKARERYAADYLEL